MATADLDAFVEEALAAGKGWSDEERRAYLAGIDDETHPFFADVDKVDPVMVEAFRQLTYENETEESLAEHFKHEGNERFKRTRLNKMYFKHAALFYTEAIKHAVMAEQTAELIALRATLLANRAAANLGVKNYGSVKRDCDESLRLAPGNIKCYYRKAKALAGLKQYDEAVQCCDAGLALESESQELQEVRANCVAAAADAAARDAATAAAFSARCSAIAAVWRKCTARGASLGPSAFEGGHHHWGGEFTPTGGDSPQDEMHWPVLLLYPASNQSDVVAAFGESDLLAEHLAAVFPEEGPPAPWDQRFEYRCSAVEVYARTRAVKPFASEQECVDAFKRAKAMRGEDTPEAEEAARQQHKREAAQWGGGNNSSSSDSSEWVHVHPGCTLQQVLQYKGYVVAGGSPVLYVYPKGNVAHEDFLKRCGSRMKQLSPVQQ